MTPSDLTPCGLGLAKCWELYNYSTYHHQTHHTGPGNWYILDVHTCTSECNNNYDQDDLYSMNRSFQPLVKEGSEVGLKSVMVRNDCLMIRIETDTMLIDSNHLRDQDGFNP